MEPNRIRKNKVMTQSSVRFNSSRWPEPASGMQRARTISPPGGDLGALGMTRRGRVPTSERRAATVGMPRRLSVPRARYRCVGDAASGPGSDTHHRQQPEPLNTSPGMAEHRAARLGANSRALRREHVRSPGTQPHRFTMHRTPVLGWTGVRMAKASGCSNTRGGGACDLIA